MDTAVSMTATRVINTRTKIVHLMGDQTREDYTWEGPGLPNRRTLCGNWVRIEYGHFADYDGKRKNVRFCEPCEDVKNGRRKQPNEGASA